MKKSCELCKQSAQVHCDSDQASLCLDCDSIVHSANFLVARHTRTFFCHICQSPTTSSSSGSKLRSRISTCKECIHGKSSDQDEKREELVVPWSPTESCSGNEEEIVPSKKRCRLENASHQNHPINNWRRRTEVPAPKVVRDDHMSVRSIRIFGFAISTAEVCRD